MSRNLADKARLLNRPGYRQDLVAKLSSMTTSSNQNIIHGTQMYMCIFHGLNINSSYCNWACSSAVSHESEAFGSSFSRESVYVSSILTFWLFCRTSDSFYRWRGIAQPMDAPTEVTRWNARTYRCINIALSIALVIYMARAEIHWTFEHVPVLFAWVQYFRCWSWPKRLTFMRFHMGTAELQAQL